MADSLIRVPQLLIVGGPNGSGKTTVALQYANQYHWPYVGADAIAAVLRPDQPMAARIAASRKYIEALEENVFQKVSFICESTLSGLTTRRIITSAHEAGFMIGLSFVFVESVDVCLARVAQRVRNGGHDVSSADIRRRFSRSIRNFWEIYRALADHWAILYNGMATVQDVAAGSGERTTIREPTLFSTFMSLVSESQ